MPTKWYRNYKNSENTKDKEHFMKELCVTSNGGHLRTKVEAKTYMACLNSGE